MIPQPIPLAQPHRGWQVFLVETLTGQVLSRLPVAGGSWVDAINDAGEVKAKVPTKWLLRQPRWRWSPWSASLLACFDGEPIALGPITAEPQGDRDFTDLQAGDLWSLLEHRVVTDKNYGQLSMTRRELYDRAHMMVPAMGTADDRFQAFEELVNTGDYRGERWQQWGIQEDAPVIDFLLRWREQERALAESVLSIREGSLGTIARRLVELAQDRPSGWLPVAFGSPEERGTNRERNYDGFNLGNNSVAKRIKEITEVINGPDVSFRPRWVERGSRVEWVMFHGTEGMPEISQSHQYVVDLTAPKARAVAPKVSSEFTPYGRVYATGEGQDKGTLIRVLDERPPDRLPLLEMVLADSQTGNPDLLESRGRGVLAEGRTVQLSVSIDDPQMPLHTWWAGDEMTAVWQKGWPQLDGGTYRMRILKRSGNFADGRRTDVEFVPEEMVA